MKIYFCSVHSSHQVFDRSIFFKEFICDESIMSETLLRHEWGTLHCKVQQERKCLTVLREGDRVSIHAIVKCVLVTICDLVWFSF